MMDYQQQLYKRRVLRLTLGIGLSSAVAFGFAWPLSFLAPMLAAGFLAAPIPRPPIVALLSFPVLILVSFFVALLISSISLQFLPLAITANMLMIFLCFYLLAQGVAQKFMTWALLGILMIPVMASQDIELALAMTMGIFWTGLAGMGFVWLAHVLLPDPEPPGGPATKKAAKKKAVMQKDQAFRHAALRTAIIFPLELYVLVGNETGDLKILIFAAILAQSPNLSAGAAGGKALIMGNVFGGLVSIVLYELLVLCPSYIFMVLLFMLLGITFGRQIFGGGKWAAMCSSGLGTVVLLIGLGTMPFGDETDSQFYSRIFQICLAAVYIVLAFKFVDNISDRRKWRRAMREFKQMAHLQKQE